MPNRNVPLRLAVAALLVVAAGWRVARHDRSGFAPIPAPTAEPFAGARPLPDRPRRGEGGTLDLDFSNGRRYLLVVGNPTRRPVRVRLVSHPVESAEQLPTCRGDAWRHDVRPLPAAVADVERTLRSDCPARHRAGRSRSPSPGLGHVAPGRSGDERTFHVHVTDGRLDVAAHYATVVARLIRRGRAVRVFLDEQVAERELAAGLVDEVVRTMDDHVVPRTSRLLGTHRDVDGDGTLAIVLTPWLDRLQGGRTSVKGLVRPTDFDAAGTSPFGDRTDVVFLNALLQPAELRAVLFHEYAHVVAIGERRRTAEATGVDPDEEDWLDEGIAHVAEALLAEDAGNLDHRVAAFLAAPERSPLVVPDYYAAGRWRDDGCRGATYSFLRFCVERHGHDVLRRVVTSTARGRANVEQATGRSFEELFREWTLALAGSEASHARPAYQWWNVNNGPCEREVAKTAAAFVRIADESGELQRVRVTWDAGSSLQLHVIPLSNDR